MKNLLKLITCLGILNLIPISLLSQTDVYNVKITNPSTDGIDVGKTLRVSGTASIPSGTYLWVLVHRIEGFKYVWYPQGDGQINPLTNKWSVSTTFGNKNDIGYEFEIAVIIVDGKEHAKLANYIADSMTSGDWKPRKMPPTLTAPTYKIVNKTSDN